LDDARLNGKRDPDLISSKSGPGVPVEVSPDMTLVLSGRDFLRTIWRRIWLIALTAIALAGIALSFSIAQTPMYEASVTLLVGYEAGNNTPGDLGGDIQGLQLLTQTLAQVIETRPVAEGAIQELNIKESPRDVLENMSVETLGNTQVLKISYKDASPEQARLIVNAIGDQFSSQVVGLTPTTDGVTANIWEGAVTPDTPISPKPVRNGLLALVLGGILGLGLAFLIEYLDDSCRSPEEAEQISGVPTFGVIRSFNDS
jgi:capsular polysaccharide biosynthesis protein